MASLVPEIPDVAQVVPFDSERDRACFDELRDVLKRYGALTRFGITLLHKHFDVAEDEVLVESIDVENRTLTISPRARLSVNDGLETSWRLDDPTAKQRCETYCESDRDQEGRPIHVRKHAMVR